MGICNQPFREENSMNITVYLGALEGKDHTLTEAVRELGTWIGESAMHLFMEA